MGRSRRTREGCLNAMTRCVSDAESSYDNHILDDDDVGACDRCGGEGYILAADGDGGDWIEDTYCGPEDAEIKCRVCNGTGRLK